MFDLPAQWLHVQFWCCYCSIMTRLYKPVLKCAILNWEAVRSISRDITTLAISVCGSALHPNTSFLSIIHALFYIISYMFLVDS